MYSFVIIIVSVCLNFWNLFQLTARLNKRARGYVADELNRCFNDVWCPILGNLKASSMLIKFNAYFDRVLFLHKTVRVLKWG